MTIGVGVLPQAKVSDALSCAKPEYVHVDTRRALTRAALIAEMRASPAAVLSQLGAAPLSDEEVLAAATGTGGWVCYSGKLSEVPSECYTLQREALSWCARPADGNAHAILQWRVLRLKLQRMVRLYQRTVLLSRGEPKLRRLGRVKAGDGPALVSALAASGVDAHLVESLHVVPEKVLRKMPAASSAEAVPWDAKRWVSCAEALGSDLWPGADVFAEHGYTNPDADVEAVADDSSSVVVALTREPSVRVARMHGGVSADASRRLQDVELRTHTLEPFEPGYLWTMPPPPPERLRTVMEDFPEVSRKAFVESLPAVDANSCTNAGMAEVILSDAQIWDVPYRQIFAARRAGTDNGAQLFAGDQLTLARFDSVCALLAAAIRGLREQLDSIDHTDPRRPDVVRTLHDALDSWKKVHVYSKKVGLFHFDWHVIKTFAPDLLRVLLHTLSLLLDFSGLDAEVKKYERWVDVLISVERMLWFSLFETARAEERYPARQQVCPDGDSVDVDTALDLIGTYIDEKVQSGDAVTIACASLLRLVHEWEVLHESVRIDDKEYADCCSMPFWLPNFNRANKFHYTALCAMTIGEKYEQSERLRRAARQLWSHALTEPKPLPANGLPLLKKRESDYVNERAVDAFKRSMGGFSKMLSQAAQRTSLSLRQLERASALCGEIFMTGFGRNRGAKQVASRLDSVVVGCSLLGPKCANAWAGWAGRTVVHDSLALAHYLRCCKGVSASPAAPRIFTVSSGPVAGLPVVATKASSSQPVRDTQAQLLLSLSHSAVAAQSKQVADVVSASLQLAAGTLVFGVEGADRLVPLRREHRPATDTLMNLCEVLALYGQTLAPDEPVRLLIHHARDFNCSASLAAPMLRSKTVEQAPNPARAPERTQRDTLRRLLPEAVASATDIEIGEAAAASDARKEAEHHQRPHCATLLQDAAREEPSNARTVKYVEEKWQKAAAEKEASEREVLHIHDEVVATGSQPTMTATRSPEEQDAMTKLQELARLNQRAEQLRSAAIALRTSAARSGADDPVVRQWQQLAMQAQFDALAYRIELERVDPIFAGKSNAAVLRSEAQAAGRDFKSFASTFQRLKELAIANRSHLQRLVEVVGNHPKISSQAQKQVQQLVKQRMAPTGIATGRPPRKTAGRSAAATYPRGAQHLPAPASAPPVSGAALVGRRVVVAGALHGRAADWLEGAVAKHHPRKGGYSIDFSDKSLRTLHVQLPHPEKQVLFLPEDSSSAPVATLPALADSPQAAWTAHETWMASRTSSAPQAADRMPTISNVERALLDEGRGPSLNPRLWAEQIPITPAMMDRLRDPRPRATATECKAHELNDEIVNAVVAALNRDNTDTHAFVFSTFMYSALENEAVDSDTVQRLLRAAPPASDLLSREQLLFMVNVPETSARPGHWYLVQANIAVGQIVAFDSAGQSHPNAIRVVQKFLEALHAKEFAGRPTWMLTDSWLGVSFGNRTPLQENGHDCGVYMLAIAWCLIRRVPLRAALDNTRMLSNPESYWRARITVWLLNGSTKHLPDPPAA